MAAGLNASADGTYGTLQVNGADIVTFNDSGNFQINSGYGSVATTYGCRAWVNFNGTGTVAIRASGNVSSITDNGTGNYTLNFTNAMPDVNYSVSGCATGAASSTMSVKILSATSGGAATLMSTTALQIGTGVSGTSTDATVATISIFR